MVFRCHEKQKALVLVALGLAAAAGCRVKEYGLAGTHAGGAGGATASGGAGGATAAGGAGGQASGGASGDAAIPSDGLRLDVPSSTGGTLGTGGIPGPDGGRDFAREPAAGDSGGGQDGATPTGGIPSTGGEPGTGGGGAGGTTAPDGSPDTPREVADARREAREGPAERTPDLPLAEDGPPDTPPDKPFVESDGSYFAEVPRGEAGPLVLAWSDEFDGERNTGVDRAKWTHVTWGPGSGAVNNEVQQYTDSTKNVFLDGSGHLVIRALYDPTAANPYTSGRIETKNKVSFGPGCHVEVRAMLPAGQGSFPAILMKGIGEDWPASGALALMEQYGQDKRSFYATAYSTDDPGSGKTEKTKYTFPDESTASADFHVYSLDWYEDRLVFQVDGQTILTTTYAPSSPFYRIAEYFVLNVALGGDMGGDIDNSAFPTGMQMIVDYVRVYAF